MRFIDEVRIKVTSGRGGDGCSSFRRERYVPFGGPDGGDGGRGGDVVMRATNQRNTLLELRHRPLWKAKNGTNGSSKRKTGACGEDLVIQVPVGTRIFDDSTGEIVCDLTEDGQEAIIATGGNPGRGNASYKTSTNRAPRKKTEGKPGAELNLKLELMLMADVGLLGFPNAGKSTLLTRVSAARPKVADYPFTTLVPSLGVVQMGDAGGMVFADVPGLIEGAADGAGLGHRFLRHLSRTRILLHLLSLGPDEELDPAQRYQAIRKELKRYDENLSNRPEIIVLTKTDLVDEEAIAEVTAQMLECCQADGLVTISSVTGDGIGRLKERIWTLLHDLEGTE